MHFFQSTAFCEGWGMDALRTHFPPLSPNWCAKLSGRSAETRLRCGHAATEGISSLSVGGFMSSHRRRQSATAPTPPVRLRSGSAVPYRVRRGPLAVTNLGCHCNRYCNARNQDSLRYCPQVVLTRWRVTHDLVAAGSSPTGPTIILPGVKWNRTPIAKNNARSRP